MIQKKQHEKTTAVRDNIQMMGNTIYFPHAQLTTNIITSGKVIIIQMVISKINEPETNISLEQLVDNDISHQEIVNQVLRMYDRVNTLFIRKQT